MTDNKSHLFIAYAVDGQVSLRALLETLEASGILEDDPRALSLFKNLKLSGNELSAEPSIGLFRDDVSACPRVPFENALNFGNDLIACFCRDKRRQSGAAFLSVLRIQLNVEASGGLP